jgi:hypothetical protein
MNKFKYQLINQLLSVLASVATGVIVGAGISVQQSFNYLKSQPTNLAKELQKFS